MGKLRTSVFIEKTRSSTVVSYQSVVTYQWSSLLALSVPLLTDIEGRCIIACELVDSLRFTGGGIDHWYWESSTIAVDPLRAVPLSD
jgi:hypothetical protein